MGCLPISDVMAGFLALHAFACSFGSPPVKFFRWVLRFIHPATMVLRAALALPLLLWAQGQGPHSLTTQCVTGEYWTGRHCCKCCPAGEYVHEPCWSPHTQGKCVKCDRGMFTAFPNGLDSCFPCATCSQDQEVLGECNSTSDQIYRCKTGQFYQLPELHEFCRWCSRCPQGHVVLHKCNSTADTVCGVPDPEHRSRSRLSFLGAICLVVGMGIAFFWYTCHHPCKGMYH
ncbi:PREDICTED: tumor necrosis factor receptor superfamily member 23-like isoform X2 [Hipposideros armiger]|uniref:Tumor necrosis factor receptor superfamily member 23-like isoform X2 n=1 Tax=Hipposideros armiger TaxID=186990 RepID=A0A8B7SA52_HIPAR|nr:PREDICTED: tumor necrosis factor receptor superfamily member 23-like isoform X2 [Hipposideros armiger]